MPSELGRVTERVRMLAATVKQHRATVGPLCALAGRAAQQAAAAQNRELATRLHRITTQRDALLADLDAVSSTLDRLAANLANPGSTAGGPLPAQAQVEGDEPNEYLDRPWSDLTGARGIRIGRLGRGPTVREVHSEAELRRYFEALLRDGDYTDVTPPGYHGKRLKLPDGTWIAWRTKSSTPGTMPTVDVNPPGTDNFKVHVNPEGW